MIQPDLVTAVQADLFGEYDAQVDAATEAIAARDAWTARFARRDYASGSAVTLGWVCPGCDGVEWGPYQLQINHGYNPDVPGEQPFDGWGACLRRDLLAAQAAAKARRDAFDAAVDLGPTRAIWLAAPCKACGVFMWTGDMVVRDGERIVHEACAGKGDAPKVRAR